MSEEKDNQLTPTQRVEKLAKEYHGANSVNLNALLQELQNFVTELESAQSTSAMREGQIIQLRQQLAAKERECDKYLTRIQMVEEYKINDKLRKDKERLVEAWNNGVALWQKEHQSIPSAFLELATTIDAADTETTKNVNGSSPFASANG